jgi:hypothetical protein
MLDHVLVTATTQPYCTTPHRHLHRSVDLQEPAWTLAIGSGGGPVADRSSFSAPDSSGKYDKKEEMDRSS